MFLDGDIFLEKEKQEKSTSEEQMYNNVRERWLI